MAKDSLSVTDNRTGKTYEVPITDETIPAIALRWSTASTDDRSSSIRRTARCQHRRLKPGSGPPHGWR